MRLKDACVEGMNIEYGDETRALSYRLQGVYSKRLVYGLSFCFLFIGGQILCL